MPSLKQCFCALLLCSPALCRQTPKLWQRDLDSFVVQEKARSLQGILDNIGADGALDQGANSGLVVASPSKVNPDYVYTWTRDSALTLKTLIDEFIAGNTALKSQIEDYIHAQAVLQTVTNPSGDFYSGAGLGEPKFNIDGKSFNGPWGRPQRDGPALRAIALMSYVNYLISNKQKAQAKNVIWPIIQNDLSYVAQYWNQTGFDLWEEVSGSSFFTVQNQHRALAQGAQMAKKLGLSCAGCVSQAPQILCFLQSFWNGQYITANINTNTVRSGKDANVLLGPISIFDIDAYCDDATMQPCNSKVLASHKALVDSFRTIYTINAGKGAGVAAAVGRYPEDVYYNGNPWYLTTLSAAEVLYDAVAQWKARHQLTVDDISYPFFKDIYPDVTKRLYRAGNDNSPFSQIMRAVTAYADSFVTLTNSYIPSNGSLSEQYGREDGHPLSAYDLTWSYASYVTMARRRSGYYPASWGTRQAAAAPATCAGTSVEGTYIPATAAGAPNITRVCTVNVVFNVNASTYYGENIFITGNIDQLGNYVPSNSVGLNADKYTDARHLWNLPINLPAGTDLTYQYIRQEYDGSYLSETINRTVTVPACKASGIQTNDAWTGPGGGT